MRAVNVREDQNYNENFLNERDKEFLAGYDACVEWVINDFCNFISELSGSDYLEKVLQEPLPIWMREIYVTRYRGKTEPREAITYLDYIQAMLLERAEGERNSMVVSALDNYSEEEYEREKAKYE